jgi:adenosylmethionine-8-amino-7-oxononanoate aminotransferase
MFACEDEGVTPDLLLVAKALGGGLFPLGACLVADDWWDERFALGHSSTFANNNVACAVGRAVLRALADDDLVARARLFADHAESVRRQGGEWLHALASGRVGEAHLLGEIGQVMAGELPGRLSEADVTVYKSLGIVVQDLASGWFLYRQAQARGLGASVAF